MAIDRWIQRWYVSKSTGDGQWCVAVDRDGIYGCSCPVWKFKKQECKHIRGIKAGMRGEAKIVEPAMKRKVVAETTKTFVKAKEEMKPEAIQSAIDDVDAKLAEIMGKYK
jgi:phenylpyruvate tautomerase PptA (4-oxalocrotonate tautomerase family)